MLDATARVTIPEAPQVLVYRDHDDRTRFYALPATPRLARDDDGKPDIHLLLYGKKQDGELQVSGGQLTIVTSLALDAEEQAAVQAALVKLIETENPTPPGASPPTLPPPNVLPPEWLSATVEVELGRGLRLEGVPSMMGDNQCALSLSLAADETIALRQDWDGGLRDAVLRYHGEVSSVEQASSSYRDTAESIESNPDRTSTEDSHRTIDLRRTTATVLPLLLEGPLAIGNDDLKDRIEVVAL